MNASDKDVLTKPEVGELLRLSKSTIERLVRQGGLPAIRLGRQVRFQRQAVERWVSEQAIAESRG